MYEKDIAFQIMYGMKGYESDGEYDNAKNGLLSASHMMKEIRRMSNVKTILIGVSTGNLHFFFLSSFTSNFQLLTNSRLLNSGIAFCGVVGHSVRRQYMVFGTPVDKAKSLMMISFDKVCLPTFSFVAARFSGKKKKFTSS